jgi:hypothetical protein
MQILAGFNMMYGTGIVSPIFGLPLCTIAAHQELPRDFFLRKVAALSSYVFF